MVKLLVSSVLGHLVAIQIQTIQQRRDWRRAKHVPAQRLVGVHLVLIVSTDARARDIAGLIQDRESGVVSRVR